MLRSGVSVIIPAFNEEKTIDEVISGTISIMDSLGLPYEVIVVNDGSTDGTLQKAMRHKATVLSNSRNRGKGYTLRRGFQSAQGDIVVTIDSDGAHDPKEIPDLLHPLSKGADIVAGSRFLGNGTHFTSRINRVGNFLMNLSIMILTGKSVTDSQTGFRAFKSNFIKSLSLDSCGYEIETEVTVKGLRNGFHYKEIPIACEKRMYSTSKLKILSDGVRIFRTILRANFSQVEQHHSE